MGLRCETNESWYLSNILSLRCGESSNLQHQNLRFLLDENLPSGYCHKVSYPNTLPSPKQRGSARHGALNTTWT